MESGVFHTIRKWNQRNGRLPQKGLIAIVSLLMTGGFLFLLKYVWPLLLALIFSAVMEPLVRFLERPGKQFRLPRKAGALLSMLLLFGVAGVAVTLVVQWLLQELFGLVKGVPGVVNWLDAIGLPIARDWYERLRLLLSPYLSTAISTAINQLIQSMVRWAGNVSAALTSGAFATALSIPDALLSLVLTVTGTYYLSADRPRISRWFHRALPSAWLYRLDLFRRQLGRGLFGQLKSQLIVSLVTAILLAVAFAIFGIPYGFSLGLVIGLADSLPVIGAGVFLIPWSLISFLFGNAARGVFLACSYLGVALVRQVLEPRIVGKNLGLYPLLTMAAMYAGYRALGFAGLLLGPLTLNVIKAALSAAMTDEVKT